jgi:hypothetical protein
MDTYVDYGWYKQFNLSIEASLLKINKVMCPRTLEYSGNVQRQYFDNVIEEKSIRVLSRHLFSHIDKFKIEWEFTPSAVLLRYSRMCAILA